MLVRTADKTISEIIREKIASYAMFTKMRLTFLVVISSVIGYAIGAEHFSWMAVVWLCIGGTLLSGASNGFNQVIERDVDALMNRTRNRPLPTGKMSAAEGLVAASLMSAGALVILYLVFNPLSAVLGALAQFSYVLLYTPLKKHSSWAVFVGAFPGAIPPMLGYVAATGSFDLYAGLLFATQFIWQFPHFWAIAWVSHDDYKKANYHLLPSRHGKDGQSAFLTFLYTLFLIPVSMLPWVFGWMDAGAAWWSLALGLAFTYPAARLLVKRDDKAAKQVMFASFLYLPAILMVYLFYS